jgi:hypothetical protein
MSSSNDANAARMRNLKKAHEALRAERARRQKRKRTITTEEDKSEESVKNTKPSNSKKRKIVEEIIEGSFGDEEIAEIVTDAVLTEHQEKEHQNSKSSSVLWDAGSDLLLSVLPIVATLALYSVKSILAEKLFKNPLNNVDISGNAKALDNGDNGPAPSLSTDVSTPIPDEIKKKAINIFQI